jgi:hypothetical protein
MKLLEPHMKVYTLLISPIYIVVVKIDLSKAYDRVSWIFLHLLLIHIGLSLPLVKWIMSCVTSASFVVLINGLKYVFSRHLRDYVQECPLLPFLFLLVVEGLRILLREEKRLRQIQGIRTRRRESLTHLLFVDNVLIFW